MKNWVIFILLLPFVAFANASQCYETDYSNFNAIEAVIEFETSLIATIPEHDYEQLSGIYAARGESYIIYKKFQEALSDFQKSYDFALLLKKVDHPLLLRSLFGQALSYGCLDEPEMVINIVESLEALIHSIRCASCHDNLGAGSRELQLSKPIYRNDVVFCSNVPIFGPEEISVEDCFAFIRNTVKYTKAIIELVPTPYARTALIYIIEGLVDNAAACCQARKTWKGCVQQLANKYHLWNQNWKILGVLPDPNRE
ncbi:MAG: hypothetical protein JSS60_03545 [Verrucomicrobia bacterium]|nr:hypothetical protein [Verrucomicrobiota bacterium]